jgi:signal transduction histidine kinase
MRGFRGRLLATVVGLVALTSLVLGLGAYLSVASSLRGQQQQAAIDQTNFNVAVLADERLSERPTRAEVAESGLIEAIQFRGSDGTIVDFGDDPGGPIVSGFAVAGAFDRLSPALRDLVAAGRVGYERLVVDDRPFLVTGARLQPAGPDFYFFFDGSTTEGPIATLGQALLAGGLLLLALALLAGGAVTRGVLRPVRQAGAAAERIAGGDLSTRLAVGSGDEFGAWATSFNRMAASLAETVDDLQTAQARQRAFVEDVSHELRTPLTALVQEAGLLRAHLDGMPPDARRAAELLVGDVARLRTLVDDLMEISRFDAAAEVLVPTEFAVGPFIRSIVAAHAPEALATVPDASLVVTADRRRLERILANLLGNAREHGGGAAVEVAAAVEGDVLRVAVADRGPGVQLGEVPFLFERFHKADPSRHLGGSGLGLALAREHAELLGGSLDARLREGGGMAFVLAVPVTGSLPDGDEPVTVEDEGTVTSRPSVEPQP